MINKDTFEEYEVFKNKLGELLKTEKSDRIKITALVRFIISEGLEAGVEKEMIVNAINEAWSMAEMLHEMKKLKDIHE